MDYKWKLEISFTTDNLRWISDSPDSPNMTIMQNIFFVVVVVICDKI